MGDNKEPVYPEAWSPEDISAYKETGQEPAKTSNGLWVTDVVRESQPLTEWTLAELYALGMGELYTRYESGTTEYYDAIYNKAFDVDKGVAHWGEEDLNNWLLFDKLPEKSPSGYFVNDPNRWVKDAGDWNDGELKDLGGGYFGELDPSNDYILVEAAERFDLPIGITWDDYCAYIQKGVTPELTSNGVLINDRVRAKKPVDEWTVEEIDAWLMDEIQVADEEALVKHAIGELGGEWYWNKEHLRVWSIEETIPEVEHDFKAYTDAELKRLIADEDYCVDEARAELERRYPPEPEPEPEIEEEVEEEPEVEVIPEPEVLEEPEEEEEVVPEVAWYQVIDSEDLIKVMSCPTLSEVIEDHPVLDMESAANWPVTSLVAWARNEVSAGRNSTEKTLCKALRALCGSSADNWTDRAVRDFVALKQLPAGFSEGVLVEDTSREDKKPSEWSDIELQAWARGKIATDIDPKSVMLSMRLRFNVPDSLSDEEAKVLVDTGELPVKKAVPIANVRTASDEQIDGWLECDLEIEDPVVVELIAELRLRRGLDQNWTDSAVLAYLRYGVESRVTTSGVLVEDRSRDPDSADKWRWVQLQALHSGDIEANFTIDSSTALKRITYLITNHFGIDCSKWSNQELVDFVASGQKPKTLTSGVFLNDPSRPLRSASEWTKGELKAWLRKEISATDKATDEDLWEELYIRFKINPCWYPADARTYVLTGEEVPSLPSGIYIRDKHRDSRPAKHWTRRELKAWCRGQIQAGIGADTQDLINQIIPLFGVSAKLDNDSIKRRVASITEESMTMTVKFVTEDLASYAKGREDAGNNVAKAAPYQALLDRCINRVLRLEGEDFVQGWTELLKFFYTHSKGITGSRKLYVGVGQMVITPRGLRNFQNMLTILQNTCDPANRDRAVRNTNWEVALKEVVKEKSRQSILAYYGI